MVPITTCTLLVVVVPFTDALVLLHSLKRYTTFANIDTGSSYMSIVVLVEVKLYLEKVGLALVKGKSTQELAVMKGQMFNLKIANTLLVQLGE